MESSVVETIADWAERGSVAFTILAAASGLIFVVASRQIKRLEGIRAEAKDARAAKLELDVATQQERAAKAETDLLQLRNEVADRTIVVTRGVVERLRRDAGTVLHIEYRTGNNEAHRLAQRISAAVGWADWRPGVPKPSKESDELQQPFGALFRELRDGVEIRGSEKLPANWEQLPRNRAAEELRDFLLANDIDATLYADAMFLGVGKPIVVRVWAKPTPDSKKARIEGFDVMSSDPAMPRIVKEQHDARERTRLEVIEQLKKEWYPDGQQ